MPDNRTPEEILASTLEPLIDAHGLRGVLVAIAAVCFARGTDWRETARSMQRIADGLPHPLKSGKKLEDVTIRDRN